MKKVNFQLLRLKSWVSPRKWNSSKEIQLRSIKGYKIPRTMTRGNSQEIDYLFLILTLALLFFGLFMVYDASVAYSNELFGEKYQFLISQIGWIGIGLTGMWILSKADLMLVGRYSFALLLIVIVLLAFTLIPTIFSPAVYGARRWLILNPAPLPAIPFIGRVSFQPSELAKLAGIIFFSFLLGRERVQKTSNLAKLLTFVIFLLILCGLVALEPDFTTAFVIAVVMGGIYFLSNAPISYFFIGTPILAIFTAFYAFSSKYRRLRIKALFDPDSIDRLGAGYHIRQIMISLGSGGLFGLGVGKSRQKYSYLPETTADSIFAIIGEEFGFIGTTILVSIFVFFILRGFKIAQNTEHMFQSLLAFGIMLWISVQILINLGAMARLLPLTGIPLPLISYGGSSTIFMLWGLGLVLNVSRGSKFS